MENALYSSFGARQVSAIYAPNNDYQVIMELLPEFQKDANAMHLIYLRSSTGKLVPLDAVTRPREHGLVRCRFRTTAQLPRSRFPSTSSRAFRLGENAVDSDSGG